MDVLEILQSYMVVPVTIACLIIGYLIKHKTSAENKNIPIIVTLCGIVLAILLQIGNLHSVPDVTMSAITGMASGFMSVGFHSVVRRWFEKQEEE